LTDEIPEELLKVPKAPVVDPTRKLPEFSARDLPDMPVEMYPRTRVPRPNDMSDLYFNPGNIESRDRDKRHGILACGKDLSCPGAYACDLDTNKCLSTDIIPASSWIIWQGKRITGSGKALVRYLITQGGASIYDVVNGRTPITYNMERYIEFLVDRYPNLVRTQSVLEGSGDKVMSMSISRNESATQILPPKLPAGDGLDDLTSVFSSVFRIEDVNISTKGWPAGVTMIPNFIAIKDQTNLFTYIMSQNWTLSKDLPDVRQYGYIYGGNRLSHTEFPSYIQCLVDVLYEYKILPVMVNHVIVTKYLPEHTVTGKLFNHDREMFEDVMATLSLGSSTLVNFTSNASSIDIPFLPGSLFIMSNTEQEPSWTHTIEGRKTDTYYVAGLPEQKWNRDIRVSITFRTIRQEFLRKKI
jgi:hypothetical protein